MNKVITVNLNGNAYQLEEQGYDALRAYLEGAAAKLAANPDRDEIMSDIEQAIADKLRALLGPYKNVAVTAQVSAIIAEMGPVEAGPETPAGDRPPDAKPGAAAPDPGPAAPGAAKRLYRLYDGAMISGVCNGIAAYWNLDPTIVRLAFVVASVFTGGAVLLAYIVMVFVIPVASTEAEKNAACGTSSFTAQEFIRRARAGYYEGMKSFPDREARREWKRKFKEDMRSWRRSFKWEAQMGVHAWQRHWQSYWAEHPYLATGWGIALPFLTLINAALALAFIVAIVSLLTNGTVAGAVLPGGTPVWLAVFVLFIVYNLVAWPLKAARHAFYYRGVFGSRPGPRVMVSLWDSFIWLAFFGVLLWLARAHFPQVQEAVHNIPSIFHDAVDSVQNWWSHH